MKSTSKYNKKITKEDGLSIIDLYNKGNLSTTISKLINYKFSNTAIRLFLKKNGYSTSKKIKDTSRLCVVCDKTFIPKYNDGPKKEKYKLCSKECQSQHFHEMKKIYTQDQIDWVIELNKKNKTNL